MDIYMLYETESSDATLIESYDCLECGRAGLIHWLRVAADQHEGAVPVVTNDGYQGHLEKVDVGDWSIELEHTTVNRCNTEH